MAKDKKIFVCSECGYESAKYWGKCPDCGSWNTFSEFSKKELEIVNHKQNIFTPKITNLNDIDTNEEIRFSTKISELDRVLGGGIVPSSIVLVGGQPGIGKSTLLTQSAYNVSLEDKKVLYASSEESLTQLKLRLDRLGLKGGNILVLSNTNIEQIIESAKENKIDLLIIDSIQTVKSENIPSAPGTITQVRECTNTLMNFAKATNTSIFLVGHITKQGTIAGPKTIEHMVDTVMYFENEANSDLRILRLSKNRFGSSEEIGVFEMTNKGLECINNPSKLLLSQMESRSYGSVICALMEGNRSMLVEIQALAMQSSFQVPRRVSTGFDYSRFVLILAVIEKMTNVKLFQTDVYLNVVGGIKVKETASDLAVACAVISSILKKEIPKDTIIIGEVGLCGEIRNVNNIYKRIKDARSMGFTKAIIPKYTSENEQIETLGMEVIKVSSLKQTIFHLFNK